MIQSSPLSMARLLSTWSSGVLLGLALLWCSGRADAQVPRDPTVPPAEVGFADGVAGAGANPLSAASGAMTVIVRDGRPYLVVGTRLYAQGEKFGQVRIERISETEIWLREGGVLRKVPQFQGIQRRTVTTLPRGNPNDSKSPFHD